MQSILQNFMRKIVHIMSIYDVFKYVAGRTRRKSILIVFEVFCERYATTVCIKHKSSFKFKESHLDKNYYIFLKGVRIQDLAHVITEDRRHHRV